MTDALAEPLAAADGSAGCAPMALVAERVSLPGGEIEVTRPRDAEALLSEEAFEHEEFLPYWAELWTSGVALAHDLSRRSLRGARTLELGCGLALPSIAAARSGGRVLATDWSPDAVAAAAGNAARNGAELETLACDWAAPDALLERVPFQLVLASDLLYEQRNVDQLLDLLPRLVDERGRILLADPGRAPSERFLESARGGFEVTTTMSPRFPRVAIHRLRLRSPSAL